MNETVRETKRADQLAVGDWLAPHELLNGAAEVLFTLAYDPPVGTTTVHLVVRAQGEVATFNDYVLAGMEFDLATQADLAVLREQAERAQKIADIRAFADWLESNADMPMPNYFEPNVHLDERHIGGPSAADAYARIHEIADRIGSKVEEHLNDRTEVTKDFGRLTYKVIAWHPDGRPVEPKPITQADIDAAKFGGGWTAAAAQAYEDDEDEAADPLGQLYSRADDEADNPTPTGPREPLHTGGMTEGGLVDETGEEMTGAAITESCVITGWAGLCTTHGARHIASGEAECGCPVYPYAGRGDAADTIVDHRRSCPEAP